MIARILIWNLFDSKTTLEELREHLPGLPEGDVWIANEAQDRFGSSRSTSSSRTSAHPGS